jgi:hypothetical protein
MMGAVDALTQAVTLPLWMVLVLAGFQKATRTVRREVRRRRAE